MVMYLSPGIDAGSGFLSHRWHVRDAYLGSCGRSAARRSGVQASKTPAELGDELRARLLTLKVGEKLKVTQEDMDRVLPVLQSSRWLSTTAAYTMVLRGLARYDLWQQAIRIFQEMPGKSVEQDGGALNAVLRCCQGGGAWQWCIWLLERASAAGSTPDVSSFRQAICACAESNRWQWACAFLADMRGRSFATDTTTLKYIVRACAGARQKEPAEAFRQELRLRAAACAPSVPKLSRTHELLLRQGAQAAQTVELQEMAGDKVSLEGTTPWRHKMYSQLTEGTVHPSVGLKILTRLYKRAGATRSEYVIMLSYLGTHTLWKSAMGLLSRVSEEMKPDLQMYTSAIVACKNVREWRQALQLFVDMMDRIIAPDIWVFNSCLSVCAKAGRWREALALLRDLESIEASPDKITFNTTLEACAVGAQWQLAICMLQKLTSFKLEAEAYNYNSALRAFASCARWHEALHMLQEQLPRVRLMPSLTQFDLAVAAAGHAGRWQLACEILAQAEQGGMVAKASTYEARQAVGCERQE
eukprot:TRINITY_DN15019_c0_g1_i2.p1 TRINITY_DN15019_c0_g1~~TRINITY_DN15019_c0_g1_i2.p1  ORF type:complete len:529 (+),score=97.04 TRINITY_DN15019_c0_g1_i2:154-1740(+)